MERHGTSAYSMESESPLMPKRMKESDWTPQLDEEVRSLKRKGFTFKEVGQELGLTERQVSGRYAKIKGEVGSPPPPSSSPLPSFPPGVGVGAPSSAASGPVPWSGVGDLDQESWGLGDVEGGGLSAMAQPPSSPLPLICTMCLGVVTRRSEGKDYCSAFCTGPVFCKFPC